MTEEEKIQELKTSIKNKKRIVRTYEVTIVLLFVCLVMEFITMLLYDNFILFGMFVLGVYFIISAWKEAEKVEVSLFIDDIELLKNKKKEEDDNTGS